MGTAAEKEAIKAGKSAEEISPENPAKAAQKETDARWMLKFAEGRLGIDMAIRASAIRAAPSICRRYGSIRSGKVTDGTHFDGRMLHNVVTNDNTASDLWADTAYRSRFNEALRLSGMTAPLVIDGLMTGAWFEAWIAQALAPTLKSGDA